MFIPIFSFVLNGFLYPRVKILIPFIPLIIYIVINALKEYRENNIKLDLSIIILLLLPVILFYKKTLIILDILVCLFVLIIYLKVNKQAIYLMMVMPLVISFTNNQKENFVKQDIYNQVNDLSKVDISKDGRFDIFKQSLNTVNLASKDNSRTSIYSSVNNSLYSKFYYDIMKNPISIKNRVACLSNSNIFFHGLMGVKTIYSERVIPIGYKEVDKNIYQNNDVLPIVYASSNTYNNDDFDKLAFPKTLDTIYNNTIVNNGNSDYQSKVTSINLETIINNQDKDLKINKISNGYRIDTNKKRKLELGIKQDLSNKIIIIDFDLTNVKSKNKLDTSITINGIKNKLSSLKAAYPNKNDHFTYILSQNETIDKLNISFSKGQYDLKNISVNVVDYDAIKNRNNEIDALAGKYNQDGNLVNGKIKVREDGYLVTSLPYQKGYQIYIDGQEVSRECVNKAFLGAKISKGKHQVKIVFKAPMKNIGYMCSGLGLVLLAFQGRRKHDEQEY